MLTKSEILVTICLHPSEYPRLLQYLCVIHIGRDGRPVKAQALLRELGRGLNRLSSEESYRFLKMADTDIGTKTKGK
jgi:hypothetical protein